METMGASWGSWAPWPWMKGPFHYEQLVRVPTLMRFPQAIPTGQRTQALFSHVDIVPTVLSAVGLPTPPRY